MKLRYEFCSGFLHEYVKRPCGFRREDVRSYEKFLRVYFIHYRKCSYVMFGFKHGHAGVLFIHGLFQVSVPTSCQNQFAKALNVSLTFFFFCHVDCQNRNVEYRDWLISGGI